MANKANKASKSKKSSTAAKKQRISPETKEKLKVGFSTIISNDAVVTAGRTMHWWTPLILAILSAVLALVPNFVNGMKTDVGANFLGTSTYGFENGLVEFGDYLDENKDTLSLTVENKKIKVQGWPASGWFSYPESTSAPETSPDGTITLAPTTLVGFEVFYNDPAYGISDSEFRTRILKNYNPITNTIRSDNPDRNTSTTYRTNHIIFNSDNFIYGKFPRNSTTAGTTYYGKYDSVKDGFNFLELFEISDDLEAGSLDATNAIRTNWQKFFKESYESSKLSSVWSMAGIMLGVNFGVILLFGFVIWLMTRGKHNPFRTVKVWEAFYMSGWAAPTPAVLSLFGFLLSSYAAFIFIFLFGIRVMWMSMRALRPYETTPSK